MQSLTPLIVPAHVIPENIAAFRALMQNWRKEGLPEESIAGIEPFLLALLDSGDEGMDAAIQFAFIPGAIRWVLSGRYWPWGFMKRLPDAVLTELLAQPGMMEHVANWYTADEIWSVLSAWPDSFLKAVLAAPGAFYALASCANEGYQIELKVLALGGKRTGWPSEGFEESWVTFQ